MEKFTIGLVLGGIGGALLTANNYKMRTLVKKSQEEVQRKLNDLMDEKIEELELCERVAASPAPETEEKEGKSRKKGK